MNEVVKQILVKVKSSECTAADMANALRLLKDQGVRMDLSSAPVKDLIKGVPFSEEEFKEMMEG